MKAIPQEFRAAYREHEREITLSKTRLGCFLGIVMVPLFCAWTTMFIRITCFPFPVAVALFGIDGGVVSHSGTRFGEVLSFHGRPPVIPALGDHCLDDLCNRRGRVTVFAGLTLVLMVLAVVLDWTFLQSVVSVLLVLMLY